jgi:hypothetical protein
MTKFLPTVEKRREDSPRFRQFTSIGEQRMRKENLVRFGAVSVALAMAAGAFMVGCSSDSEGGTPTTTTDAGTTPADTGTTPADTGTTPADTGAPTDAARPDSGPVDAGPPGPKGILIDVVHASPDTPAVGLCLGGVVSGNVVFPAPFDKVSGPLPRYAATQIAVPDALVATIQSVAVRVYAIPGYVPTDAGAPSCADVTAPDAGRGAVLLKEFPANYFAAGKGYIIAATGCSNASTATVAKCGADATDPTKALALNAWVKQFDRAFQPAANLGAQFVHLSPQAQSIALPVLPDGGTAVAFANGVKVAVGTPAAPDAGTAPTWLAWVTGANAVKFGADPTAIFSAAVPVDPNALVLGVATAAAGASPTQADIVAPIPMQIVAAATLGPSNAAVPTYFKKGLTYTFFSVGDLAQSSNPQAPNFGADFFRVVALPNNPPPAADGGAN